MMKPQFFSWPAIQHRINHTLPHDTALIRQSHHSSTRHSMNHSTLPHDSTSHTINLTSIRNLTQTADQPHQPDPSNITSITTTNHLHCISSACHLTEIDHTRLRAQSAIWHNLNHTSLPSDTSSITPANHTSDEKFIPFQQTQNNTLKLYNWMHPINYWMLCWLLCKSCNRGPRDEKQFWSSVFELGTENWQISGISWAWESSRVVDQRRRILMLFILAEGCLMFMFGNILNGKSLIYFIKKTGIIASEYPACHLCNQNNYILAGFCNIDSICNVYKINCNVYLQFSIWLKDGLCFVT